MGEGGDKPDEREDWLDEAEREEDEPSASARTPDEPWARGPPPPDPPERSPEALARGGGRFRLRDLVPDLLPRGTVRRWRSIRVAIAFLVAGLFAVGWAPVMRTFLGPLTWAMYSTVLGSDGTEALLGAAWFNAGALAFYVVVVGTLFLAFSIHVIVRPEASIFALSTAVIWVAYTATSLAWTFVTKGPALPEPLLGVRFATIVFALPLFATLLYDAVFLWSHTRKSGVALLTGGAMAGLLALWFLSDQFEAARLLLYSGVLSIPIVLGVVAAGFRLGTREKSSWP